MKIPEKMVIWLCWSILVIAALYVNYMPEIVPVSLKMPFTSFPYEINGWISGSEKTNPDSFTAGVIAKLGSDDILMREYTNAQGDKLELYLSYFKYTKEQKAPHTPGLCWVGSGWALKDLGEEDLVFKGIKCPSVRIKKVLAEKDGNKTLLLYTYKINERYEPDFLRFRAISAIDTILNRKNCAFTLQLSSRLGDQDLDKKESQMKDFLTKAFIVLERDFLP